MRALLLVLDGLGVGEMLDVVSDRLQDKGAFTLRNIVKDRDLRKLDNFINFGLGNIVTSDLPPASNPIFFYGKAELMHHGADTFWGHQEIAGSKPTRPIFQFVREVADELVQAYKEKGYKARTYGKDKDIVIVEEKVAVADNMEADMGQIINVIGSVEDLSWQEIQEIGKVTRAVVKTSRVNYHAADDINLDYILSGQRKDISADGKTWHIGIDVAKLNIYDRNFHAYHHGYGIDPKVQIPSILTRNGFPVSLIGKAQDIIECPGAEYNPAVYTDKVLELIINRLSSMREGFIFANVQEIDLAGHSQDADKGFRILSMVNQKLPEIVNSLNKGDLFIITADHGNDPFIGHSNHTREQVPILAQIIGNKVGKNLGTRKTLSDIAATISDYFGVEPPQNGTSFLKELKS